MRETLPFEKALYLTKIDRKVQGDNITRQNQAIETKTKTFDFATTRVQVPKSSIMQVQHQMLNTSFTIQEEVFVTRNPKSKQFCNRCNAAGLKMFAFAFPLFGLIGWVKTKVLRENVEAMILVTPTWQTQPWYTLLQEMSIQRPLHLLVLLNLLLNPLGEKHPFMKTRSLRLAAWKITGKLWKCTEFQLMQPNLSPCPGDQVLFQVMNRSETSGLAGTVNNKLIQFVHH